jgi:hypothetical protein
MKKIFLLSLLFFVATCHKSADPPPPPVIANNNEIKATILYVNGNTTFIYAAKETAGIGCDTAGGSKGGPMNSYVISALGSWETGEHLYIYSSGINGGCVVGTGTFPANFDYYPSGMTGTNRPRYYSAFANDTNISSITYTINNNKNKEGFFRSVCRNENSNMTDSVIITGTFKGDFIGQ